MKQKHGQNDIMNNKKPNLLLINKKTKNSRNYFTNHPWYGTRIEECKIWPTKLFTKELSEKLPWPLFQTKHQCLHKKT